MNTTIKNYQENHFTDRLAFWTMVGVGLIALVIGGVLLWTTNYDPTLAMDKAIAKATLATNIMAIFGIIFVVAGSLILTVVHAGNDFPSSLQEIDRLSLLERDFMKEQQHENLLLTKEIIKWLESLSPFWLWRYHKIIEDC